jgi:pyruvate dehydrogenase E1 component
LYAAYSEALSHKGQPTVILAKTVKGYGLGKTFEGRNAVHQMKKLKLDVLKSFRDDLRIPISNAELEADPYRPPYYNPGPNHPAIQYLLTKRRELGGAIPQRRHVPAPIALPDDKHYKLAKKGSGKQEVATTMAFARLLKDLLRDESMGKRFVPIIPDEARTFGMDSFFPTSKIYNPAGQNYVSVDRELLLAYKESVEGQILHTGINEAGAMAAFVAAGTSYATQGEVMVPIYVLYSMFGFQRTGDQMWLAGDQMARGFIIGATAGKTTLTGEGLQHADGHSHLIASTNDAVLAYDPAFAFEIGYIVKAGLERMYGGQHGDPNVFYYLTVYNEPMIQPAEPAGVDVDGLLRGMYKYRAASGGQIPAQILASGVSVPWALKAQEILASDWNVAADVWSVTSWNELRRDGRDSDRYNFLHPAELPRIPYVTEKLRGERGPVIAVSDFMHAVADQIRPYVPTDFATLGGDGFGFSDTRAAARRHFAIDTESIVVRVLEQLAKRGEIDRSVVIDAFQRYRLDDVTAGTTGNPGGDA